MNIRHNLCFYIAVFLLLLSRVSAAIAITADELANTIEKMESAIIDISLEYEWFNDPPWTLEELQDITNKKVKVAVNKDIPKYKFSAARLSANREPNNQNLPLFDRLLLEESVTLLNEHGAWHSIVKETYDGKIAKRLLIGGFPQSVTNGEIRKSKNSMLPLNLTPIGFSVLRLSASKVTEETPLSAMLRRKEFVHIDNTIQKINGFNTISVDLLTEWNKQIFMHIYFSVDHGYTPVKYEYIRVTKTGPKVAIAVEVNSLEQVAEGLWFPSSGIIRSPDDEETNVYRATSKIVINQGLTDEHFDIKFPPGTKVYDEIKNLKYVVKSH